MNNVIYLDVLLAINLFVDYFLIYLTSRIAKRKVKRRRILLGAAIGALYSLVILLSLPPALLLLLQALSSVVIVWSVFSFQSPKEFLRVLSLFFLSAVLFSGIMFAIWIFVTPGNMFFRNGIVYFDISPIVLIVTVLAAYGILQLIGLFTKGEPLHKEEYQVQVTIYGRTGSFQAFVDSGNFLTDLFSDVPVVICCYKSFRDLLPQKLRRTVETYLTSMQSVAGGEPLSEQVRLVPYRTMGKSGLLPAIYPDAFCLKKDDQNYIVERVLIALSDEKLRNGKYEMILGDNLTTYQQRQGIRK